MTTKVLQISPGGLEKGGVQADIMYPVRILSSDDVQFDVVVFTDEERFYDQEFLTHGRIYRIPLYYGHSFLRNGISLYTRFFKIYRKMKKILHKNGPYDAIHCRNAFDAAPCLLAAKKENVPVRIAHSHTNAPPSIRLARKFVYGICTRIINKNATLKLGVTKGSLEYLYGKNGGGHVIKNPTVDLTIFDPKKYIVNGRKGLACIEVGTVQPRKNQMFALRVFHEIKKCNKDAHMVFIGYDPANKNQYCIELEEEIKRLGLSECVSILPQDADVAEALANSDISIMPSITEGLPNTALEAQAMGVPCFISTNVTTETDLGLCTFLDLGRGAEYWADEILKYIGKNGTEKHYLDMSGWDNRKVCQEYLKIWRGEPWPEE